MARTDAHATCWRSREYRRVVADDLQRRHTIRPDGRAAPGTVRAGTGRRPESEAAFTVLVERHGPMVLGACRAVLGNRHDAEDACQATFLVLAQRAGLIRRRDSVASWLYGVARRVALRAVARRPGGASWSGAGGRGSRSPNWFPSRPRSPGPSSTRNSIASPSRSARRLSSATWRGTPTNKPPGSSTARLARFRVAWGEDGNDSGGASSGSGFAGHQPDRLWGGASGTLGERGPVATTHQVDRASRD